MDFTLKTYKRLLQTFIANNYLVITYEMYCSNKYSCKLLILRHDVDDLVKNALKMAEIENALGVKATYYFRVVKQSNSPDIMSRIAELGHEIGYHYEDLAYSNGDLLKAKQEFEKNLAYFRTFYPIKTVCMHGGASSEYDNRHFWNAYRLESFDLIGEPYLTTDFKNIFYITDTGHSWNGWKKYAVRDIVENDFGLEFRTSNQIIKSIENGDFPQQSLMLAHTLWSDNAIQWSLLQLREFIRNRIKYIAKRNKTVNNLYRKFVNAYWKR